MARVELKDGWNVESEVRAVEKALRAFLRRQKMRVVEEADGEFEARQGSQLLTRLLGGWFVPAVWLPKRATVLVRQAEGGVKVRARIEESLGFGVLDPLLKNKYQGYFVRWMDDLHEAVR